MKARIMVVDDEPQFERLILQRFRKQVKSETYEFVFAQDGVDALSRLDEDGNISMVLTDINMPRMDGLTLISQIREKKPTLKTVVVSAYGDMKNIRAAMNLGAFDFITKPIEFADLEKTIQKTLEETALLKKAEMANVLTQQNQRLEQLDKLKSRFFTNISHEFRTPLTVIAGMADQIQAHPDRLLEKGLLMIRRNTYSLLDLVNQILDLHKVESGSMEVKKVRGDVMPFFKWITESFQYLAESQDIELQFLSMEQEIVMDYDSEKMLRILSNLLGNGIKFTNAGGKVFFQVDKLGDQLQIRVKDTGIGITPEQLPSIFDRFYQIERLVVPGKTGTGVGLSLVKEFVELLEGQIEVESQVGEGTLFTLRFPITQDAKALVQENNPSDLLLNQMVAARTPAIVPALYQKEDGDVELPSILIVEDNPDIAQYLITCLEGQYQLDWAPDGEIGIEKALETVPDLIISDVMMPKKDGFEVCRVIKEDKRTSHIPIVILTAKADALSRIEGLKLRADEYLAKPFDKEELMVRLDNLRAIREQLRNRYQSLSDIQVKEGEEAQKEDQFVLDAKAIIHENIEDENFGIMELCRAIGMSRTQLHRKIKALTNRSTSSFIRSIRLIKAKELLSISDLNISQVAYEVGFKDPKYFSRTFAEEFGMPPADFRK